MQKLLSGCKLGDQRPTQLLRELNAFARDKVSDELKPVCLQRLPFHARVILQPFSSELPEFAKLAYKITKLAIITSWQR